MRSFFAVVVLQRLRSTDREAERYGGNDGNDGLAGIPAADTKTWIPLARAFYGFIGRRLGGRAPPTCDRAAQSDSVSPSSICTPAGSSTAAKPRTVSANGSRERFSGSSSPADTPWWPQKSNSVQSFAILPWRCTLDVPNTQAWLRAHGSRLG